MGCDARREAGITYLEMIATAALQEVVSDLYAGFLSAEDRRGVKPPDHGVLPPLVLWGSAEAGPYTWPVTAPDRRIDAILATPGVEFLSCGVLSHGFTRLRCTDCSFERLLPFSCMGRGFCPSCGGRRMAERAAYLVDEVLPWAPVRQWVLTLPYRLRYRLAWDHALCRAVLAVYARVLLAFYARTARSHGVQDGQTGTVTVIQRFG